MWILYALGASIFWGLTYVLNEQVYKKASIFTSLGLTSLIVSIVLISFATFTGQLKPDIETLFSSKKLLFFFFSGVGALLIAELFIGFSIVAKNATLAGLIEISYPVFIALFGYILFKNTQISLSTCIGGILIFLGVFIIYYFNK